MSEYLPAIIGLLLGGGGAMFIMRLKSQQAASANQKAKSSSEQASRDEASRILTEAEKEAEHITKDAKLAAKDELIRVREEFEASCSGRRQELSELERRLNEREANIERKMDLVQTRLDDIATRDGALSVNEKRVSKREEEIAALRKRLTSSLEGVAGMSRDQARVQIMQELEQELINERGTLIRRHLDQAKQSCQREAQKLLITTMQRLASECAYERTTRTVQLPSDEMKGRIIGREGRNIRVFEAATGVNVLIDDTPQAVVITCFDPVRLEVAHKALERLVEDGRIHPTRVEEVVEKAQSETEEEIVSAAEEALHELQIADVPAEVLATLGRLRFRYSFSQNVLHHSIEVARFMAMIASELGLNVERAKRMGLFHDIGKAMDHDVEGSHAIIGMDFLRRANFLCDEVLNGVGCHHEEIPAETPLASLVSVADAMSAGRPGARSETTEFYVKRLEQLEEIGYEFKGVEQCYAVQAGREIRVTVEPDQVSENEALTMAKEMADRIEADMQYPGQIKVCVVRETRAVQYAK